MNCVALPDWLSAFAAIVALILSCVSISLTRKSIEAATRPELVPYVERLNIYDTSYYLVLKNFGASSAKILKFKSSVELSTFTHEGISDVFNKLEGTTFPSGYRIVAVLDKNKVQEFTNKKIENKEAPSFEIQIEYQNSRSKRYQETISINFGVIVNVPQIRFESTVEKPDLQNSLANGVLEFEERLL